MARIGPNLFLAAALCLSGVVVLGAVGYVGYSHLRPGGAPNVIGGPFALTDQNGRTVTDADFKGEPFLVFFGYTHCPDVCPATLFQMSQMLDKLGPDKKVGALFVTVDPERDTPAVLKDYLSSFDKRITGLTGSRPAVDAALHAYRVYSKRVPGEGGADYSMDHTSLVYLMDKEGHFVNAFNLDQPPEAAARDLAAYL